MYPRVSGSKFCFLPHSLASRSSSVFRQQRGFRPSTVHYSSALKGFDPTNTRNYVSIIHDQGLKTRLGKIPETNVPGTLLNGLTAEEEAATTAMRGNLNVHFFNTRTAFQTGELDIYDDQVWADYLAQLEAYGLSTVLKVYQNCYDRFLANQ